ncbi:MAG: hypothetical protein ACE5KX_04720 [Acidimicrobiia bacterium]
MSALPPHQRPFVEKANRTEDLPDTPQRSYRIPATSWEDAPEELPDGRTRSRFRTRKESLRDAPRATQ